MPAIILSEILSGSVPEEAGLAGIVCNLSAKRQPAVKEAAEIASGRERSCAHQARSAAQGLVLLAWLALSIRVGFLPMAKELLGKKLDNPIDPNCPGSAKEALNWAIGLTALLGFGAFLSTVGSSQFESVMCPAESIMHTRTVAAIKLMSYFPEDEIREHIANEPNSWLPKLMQAIGDEDLSNWKSSDILDGDYKPEAISMDRIRDCSGRLLEKGALPTLAAMSALMLWCIRRPDKVEAGE